MSRRSSVTFAEFLARRMASTTRVKIRMSPTGYAKSMILARGRSPCWAYMAFSPSVQATKMSARKTIEPSSHSRSRVEVPRGAEKKARIPAAASGTAPRKPASAAGWERDIDPQAHFVHTPHHLAGRPGGRRSCEQRPPEPLPPAVAPRRHPTADGGHECGESLTDVVDGDGDAVASDDEQHPRDESDHHQHGGDRRPDEDLQFSGLAPQSCPFHTQIAAASSVARQHNRVAVPSDGNDPSVQMVCRPIWGLRAA